MRHFETCSYIFSISVCPFVPKVPSFLQCIIRLPFFKEMNKLKQLGFALAGLCRYYYHIGPHMQSDVTAYKSKILHQITTV